MLLQSQIAEVVDAQAQNFLNKDTGQPRELLSQLKIPDHHALIITGIRRCGKSTLLLQLLQTRYKNAFYLHFEDPRLAGFEANDFTRLNNEIKSRKPAVLFFDEIQVLDQWELFVRHLLDENYKVIITGSNATLLSRELGTKLTGRHLSVELFPFSYREFSAFKKLKHGEKTALQYLQKGGFPEYLKTENGFLLNQLLEDILYRDIAVRYSVRDVKSLKQLAVYLISNIGKPVSANNLTRLFNIKATSTMLDYFSHLENAYIVQFLPLFSHSVKKQIRNMKKVYTIDPGLFTENSIVFTDEKGRRMENAVFLHLRRKYRELYYFSDQGECDFIALEKGRPKELIQVCYELGADNMDRELNGLTAALDFFKVKTGKIVTLHQRDQLATGNKVITVEPLNDFLNG
ncbi:ATP-binding protein [Niabella sp.]|uniref:ATP-binding protein n=1 Tax=Niabella sp. TaxID=1962976 RepID=UPI0026140227|nr:ATP-binding protein [Niabella sp.]